jgi:hypothetical protein
MAHYAFLDKRNIVTEVIVGNDEMTGDWEKYYGEKRGQKCLRTSYNGNIRKQFAGVGYTYDETADVFIAPAPYPSWVLDEHYDWQAPIKSPGPGYEWNENLQNWEHLEQDGN